MNDMELERALRNRSQQVPPAAEATRRAFDSLGLSSRTRTSRHPLTLLACVAPTLVSCLAVYINQKDALQNIGSRASHVLPELLRQTASAWQQLTSGLEPNLVLTFGVMAIAFSLTGSWLAGSAFFKPSSGV